MTVEEALFILEHGSTVGLTEYLKAISVIKEHIKELEEKQIPKKPIEKDTEKPCLYCPTCGIELFVENHHCKCGQALDWSDEE